MNIALHSFKVKKKIKRLSSPFFPNRHQETSRWDLRTLSCAEIESPGLTQLEKAGKKVGSIHH